jgi:hypothetical protein
VAYFNITFQNFARKYRGKPRNSTSGPAEYEAGAPVRWVSYD